MVPNSSQNDDKIKKIFVQKHKFFVNVVSKLLFYINFCQDFEHCSPTKDLTKGLESGSDWFWSLAAK